MHLLCGLHSDMNIYLELQSMVNNGAIFKSFTSWILGLWFRGKDKTIFRLLQDLEAGGEAPISVLRQEFWPIMSEYYCSRHRI